MRATDGAPGFALAAVILNACRAKPGQAVSVDRPLPGQELVDGQLIPLAGLIEAEQSASDRGHNFRLAPDHPAFCIERRQIGNRKRAAVWTDDIARARSELLFGHDTLYTSLTSPNVARHD